MSDQTVTTPVKPSFLVRAKAKARRVLRHPVTLVTAAAVGGGAAAYAGTNKALRNTMRETAVDTVEAINDMLETTTES